MLKRKKIVSAILAVVMLGALSTSVFAGYGNYVTGHLDSTGDIVGNSNIMEGSADKIVKAYTSSVNKAHRIYVKMAAVNTNTGATLVSGVKNLYSSDNAEVPKTVKASILVTVYGTHQVWGTASEYWGEYTSVREE